jgi:hypothetical protein
MRFEITKFRKCHQGKLSWKITQSEGRNLGWKGESKHERKIAAPLCRRPISCPESVVIASLLCQIPEKEKRGLGPRQA